MANKTYRYYSGKPVYPFGYGLTYGDTAVLSWSVEGDTVTVTAENRGKIGTEDVLEVFVKDNASPFAVPNGKLCAFRRVYLAAGEKADFVLTLDKKTFTVVNDEGEEVPGSGDYSFTVSFNNQAG